MRFNFNTTFFILIYLYHQIDNRFGENVLRVIEKIFRYQQKICLAGEGIKTLKIEVSNDHVLFIKCIQILLLFKLFKGFETKQIESIHKLVEEKRRIENKSAKKY